MSSTKKEQCAMLPEFLSFSNDVKSSTVGISKNRRKRKKLNKLWHFTQYLSRHIYLVSKT